MKLHIEVTDDKVIKAVKETATKEHWSLNKLGKIAVEFYLKARKAIKKEA